MPMNRTVLALFLISIVVIAGATWVILSQTENQIEPQVENQTYDVKIVDFKWTSGWGFGPVGTLWGRSFNITLQNIGNMDAQGLYVDIKYLANNTEIWAETGLYSPGIIGYTAEYNVLVSLNASETKELRGAFVTSLGISQQAQGDRSYAIRVIMNETILDEKVIKPTDYVKVIGLSAEGPDISVVNVISWKFNVTIQNKGSNKVSGITLVARMLQKGRIVAESTKQISTIHIGEIQKIETVIEGGTELSGSKEEYSYAVILTISGGNIILDQYELP